MKLQIQENFLHLIADDTNKLNLTHAPLGTKIIDFKRIKQNCNIVHEDCNGFPKDINNNSSNIYCLDDNFRMRWTIEVPLYNNCFPNPIQWNIRMLRNSDHNISYIKDDKFFTCHDWRGVTVSVDYETGQVLESELTK